eukprot:CAMPEP_0185705084 /NCGR_PEP_ID=MMETSP1164-20130828/18998_1 /TAXON_ID=1104430 /ORGANISM="Chrysoreinhardia sp, Strain CCMP2950" /LENGTH=561 /DNA_ID=CAMNT_0028372461 /DNA_START=14 /DNA_END=1699 /DNA_ORIENTATION=+
MRSITACISLALLAVGSSASEERRVVVERPTANRRWTPVGRAAREHRLELQFWVKQQNLDGLYSTLEAVSDPHAATYGQHLSSEAVDALVAPRAEDVAAVEAFCAQFGASPRRVTPSGDVVAATVTVATAEAMLNASYTALRRRQTTIHRVVDAAGYSLPETVARAVDFVAPTVHLPPLREAVDATNRFATYENKPETLRTLYDVGLNTTGAAAANKVAVTAFLEQYYSAKDLQLYWTEYCAPLGLQCGEAPTLPALVGDATSGTPAGTEAMLDIETVTGVAGGVAAEFWGFSGRSPDNAENEPFMTWLAAVASAPDATVPKIFSTSYGEDEASWSYDAASRLNTEFAKAGARGITLLFSSGDEGANCEDGTFEPETPNSSPYVTAVGGTEPTSGFPAPGSEQAAPLASGGFSNRWARPSYQDAFVEAYFATAGVPTVEEYGYNVTGRGVPDIAAQAYDFCVTPFGCGVAGTSCSTPTVAGIFALLNDLRLQKGKSTLGFLNPLLYSDLMKNGTFFDVAAGASDGCGPLSTGWPAVPGWDAVTGLGTLSYKNLAAVVLSLP